MEETSDAVAATAEGRREPELITRARNAIKQNPGYVAHGPEMCPRDILEAYQLGQAQAAPAAPAADATDAAGGEARDEPLNFRIRNPLRTVSAEAVKRLGEFATDLECGLSAQTCILSDWTTHEERMGLSNDAQAKLAYERLAGDIRAILGALQPQALADAP